MSGWVFVIMLTWHIPRAVLILLGLDARAGTNNTYAWDRFPKGPIFKIPQDSSCGRNILIQQIQYNRIIPEISRGFRIWSQKWHTVTNSKVTRWITHLKRFQIIWQRSTSPFSLKAHYLEHLIIPQKFQYNHIIPGISWGIWFWSQKWRAVTV